LLLALENTLTLNIKPGKYLAVRRETKDLGIFNYRQFARKKICGGCRPAAGQHNFGESVSQQKQALSDKLLPRFIFQILMLQESRVSEADRRSRDFVQGGHKCRDYRAAFLARRK
jgi:hypothetical protein